MTLEGLIDELGFSSSDFERTPAQQQAAAPIHEASAGLRDASPATRVWLLWDTDDLVAVYSSEVAAEAARVVYTKRVRAELAAEAPCPARIHTKVTPIDVQN